MDAIMKYEFFKAGLGKTEISDLEESCERASIDLNVVDFITTEKGITITYKDFSKDYDKHAWLSEFCFDADKGLIVK